MKKVRVIAHTPVGVFYSTISETTADDIGTLDDLIKTSNLKYLAFDTEKGKIILKQRTVENSVFLIETIED